MASLGFLPFRWWPPVIGLFASAGPAAVRRLVIAVHVDAIERGLLVRTRTHVAKKNGTRVTPFITHLNATATVVAVTGILRVVTALLHGGPCAELTRDVATMGASMTAASFDRRPNDQTSTTAGSSRSQRVRTDGACGAAVAVTQPMWLQRVDVCASNNRQVSDAQPSKVDQFGHKALYRDGDERVSIRHR